MGTGKIPTNNILNSYFFGVRTRTSQFKEKCKFFPYLFFPWVFAIKPCKSQDWQLLTLLMTAFTMFCNRIEHAVPDRSYDNVNQGMPAWLTTATLEIHHSHYSVLSRYFHNHSWVVFQLVFAQQTSHQLVHLTCCYFHLLKQLNSLQSLRNAEHLWHSENKGNCNPK